MNLLDTPAVARACRACRSTSNPARVCLPCAREGRTACTGHTPAPTARPPWYCHHCAAVYPLVAACVDEHEPAYLAHHIETGVPLGLTDADYEDMWAGESADGAPPEALRLIAGFLHGWRTQSGAWWPLPRD